MRTSTIFLVVSLAVGCMGCALTRAIGVGQIADVVGPTFVNLSDMLSLGQRVTLPGFSVMPPQEAGWHVATLRVSDRTANAMQSVGFVKDPHRLQRDAREVRVRAGWCQP